MLALLSAAAVAFGVSILATPYAIRYLRRRNLGQFIQEEVEGHSHKHGTPTMGGVVIMAAVLAGFTISHVSFWSQETGFGLGVREFKAGGLLVMFAFVGMGAIGFIDDFLNGILDSGKPPSLADSWQSPGSLPGAPLRLGLQRRLGSQDHWVSISALRTSSGCS